MKKTSNENSLVTKKDLNSIFVRSISYNGSFNHERQLNLGWVFSIMPVLRRLYGNNKEEMSKALTRHLEFNNITPYISTSLMGITVALEEQNAQDENFEVDTINAVKVGLMSPLSGIGDSIFFGTIRTIAAAIGIDLALKGSMAGPLLYFLIFNIPNFLSRYLLLGYGYNLGTAFIGRIEKSGIMGKVFKGSAILGLMVIGAMIYSTVRVPLAVSFGDWDLLTTLNGIFPNILSLGFTLFLYWLLKRDFKVSYILYGIILFGILGAGIGIF